MLAAVQELCTSARLASASVALLPLEEALSHPRAPAADARGKAAHTPAHLPACCTIAPRMEGRFHGYASSSLAVAMRLCVALK